MSSISNSLSLNQDSLSALGSQASALNAIGVDGRPMKGAETEAGLQGLTQERKQ